MSVLRLLYHRVDVNGSQPLSDVKQSDHTENE